MSGLAIAGRISLLVASLAAAMVTLECDTKETAGPQDGLPNVLSGTSMTPAHVEGEWRVDTTVTTNTCRTPLVPLINAFVVRISQAGSDLTAVVFDRCGNQLSTAKGTSDFNKVVTLQFEQGVAAGTGCTLAFDQTWTGTVQSDPNKMIGSRVLEVSGQGGCGGPPVCAVHGAMTAAHCPGGGCGFDACTP